MFNDRATGLTVITLIPGEDYIVLVEPADQEIPDASAMRELRIQAQQRRDVETLGVGDTAEALATISGYIAGGVVGNAAWASFPAVGRWIKRIRPRARRLTGAEDVIVAARTLCPKILGHIPASCVVRAVSKLPDADGWTALLDADGARIRMTVEATGTVVAFTIVTGVISTRVGEIEMTFEAGEYEGRTDGTHGISAEDARSTE